MKAARAALKLAYVALLGACLSFTAGTPAKALTYNWSYACLPNCVGGSGTLTTGAAPGPVLIISIAGTWDGLPIVAIANFFGADDILLALTPSIALDSQGLSFLLSDGGQVILKYTDLNGYESRGFNFSDGSPRGQDFFDNGTFSVTASTPLPLSLPLFASGLGALGLLGWRRKRKAGSLSSPQVRWTS